MNKKTLQEMRFKENKYLIHFKVLYQEYLELGLTELLRGDRASNQIKRHNKRGAVDEAEFVLKNFYQYTDEDLAQIKQDIERRLCGK